MNPTTDMESQSAVAQQELEHQIDWYDRAAGRNRKAFWAFKAPQIGFGAVIPFLAALGTQGQGPVGPYLIGALGVLVVIFEGFQQLGQFQTNWFNYRSTCEALRWERYLYLVNAGPYATAPKRDALLAEHLVALLSKEHARWATAREEALSLLKDGKPGSAQ